VRAVAAQLIDEKEPVAVLEGRVLVLFNEKQLCAAVRKDEKPDLERQLPELKPRQPQRQQQKEREQEREGHE
jgi:hypothetical protein